MCFLQSYFHIAVFLLITLQHLEHLEHVPEPLGGGASQGEGHSGRGKENPAASTNGVQASPRITSFSYFDVLCF